MHTVAQLKCITEDDIAQALISLSPASWPQDETDLLVLFNCLLDMKSGTHIQGLVSPSPHRSPRRLRN